jgi:hypothetical protein
MEEKEHNDGAAWSSDSKSVDRVIGVTLGRICRHPI